MNNSEAIEQLIDAAEQRISLPEITIRHGLNSYRYGSSGFLNVIFSVVQPGKEDVLYDLGSGYGLVLLYGAERYPEAQFKGIEIVNERYELSVSLLQESGLKNVELLNTDMFTYDFSDGTIFYIFNPLFGDMYPRLLERLEEISKKHPITVIAESRCSCFDDAPWLTKYHETAIDVVHRVHFYKGG